MTTCGLAVRWVGELRVLLVIARVAGLPEKDLQKLRYTLDIIEKMDDTSPFTACRILDPAVVEVNGKEHVCR